MIKSPSIYILIYIISFSFCSCKMQSSALHVASKKKIPVIYSSVEGIEIERGKKLLSSFFMDRELESDLIELNALSSFEKNKAYIILETLDNHPLSDIFGLDLMGLSNSHSESHMIKAYSSHNGGDFIFVVGKDADGVESGIHYLFSKLNCNLTGNNWRIYCPVFEEIRKPFFSIREATLCPTGRVIPDNPMINYENWNSERLSHYPSFLRSCGFNSLQLMELITYNASTSEWQGGYRGGLPKDKTIDDIENVLKTLIDEAHNEGMRVSQYIWGSPADGNKWDDIRTRPKRQEFYKELAKRYGEKVDHIITHWVDEGTEGGYETPLTATMFIWNEYKKYNPNVQVTCDAWFNKGLYNGISSEKYASKDVAIAIERWYNKERAEQIQNSGRKVGIWGWYLSDFEMTYGSNIYTKTLDKYYTDLPEEASVQVDWISSELCFHGLPSRINMYVVGRKMWNPKTPLENILYDYCKAMYGEPNADNMKFIYETVEEGQKEVRYGMVEKDRYANVLETLEFQEKVDLALKKIDEVRISPHWISNFSDIASVHDDIINLKTSLIEFKQQIQ